MMKNKCTFSVILLLLLMMNVGCHDGNDQIATVTVNPDSDFVTTFAQLDLGNVFDFEFKLPEAENKWIYLWVESYIDGVKGADPLINLGYGLSPDEKIDDNIGFAILNLSPEETYVSLYSSSVSSRRKIEEGLGEDVFNSLQYAISDKATEIKLGEEKLLAVYRETKGDSIQSINFDQPQAVEEAIEQSELAYLLKIIIEEE